MLKIVAVLCVLVAVASSQCTVDGKSWSNGATSITFGAAVGENLPAMLNGGGKDLFSFGYWTTATATRWEITTVGAPSGTFCSSTGQYNAQFGGNCATLTLTAISDDCADRSSLLNNKFALTPKSSTGDCVSTGTVLTTTLEKSSSLPALSGEVATIVFGADGFASVSVSTRGIIFQQWVLSSSSAGQTSTILDLGSFGQGLACSSQKVGVYLSDWNADCGVQLCGVSDSCVSRGELFGGAKFNGFETSNVCTLPPGSASMGGFGLCNPDANEWTRHPYDCLEQNIAGGCMFCLGRANGVEHRQCLDREGAGCNELFNSNAGKSFCTLEFECPASTATISIALFISSLVALVLFR